MDNTEQISPGSKVKMNFSLSLADGPEAVSTFSEEPIEFVMGDGTLDDGLERCLYGMSPGDEQNLRLAPGQAYGERDEERIQNIPLTDFPQDMDPAPGQVISFVTPSNEETLGAIVDMNKDNAVVDFNHPLAGRELDFKIQIIDVHPPVK